MIVGLERMAESKWSDYLTGCPEATIYHTPEWMHFLSKTFDYEPEHIFLLNETGDIDGILPLMRVESWLTKNRMETMPFSHICGMLGNSNALISEIVSKFSLQNIKYIQINAEVNHSDFVQESTFCTHVLSLLKSKEEIWKGMDKGSTRWAVNKSKKEGVVVEETTDESDLQSFYDLNCLTKKELGVPCHPYIFFKNMMDILKNHVHLYVSRYKGEVIGGGIMLEYNGQVVYGYGAADPTHLKQYPYNAFVWKSIEDAVERCCNSYDFGRTSHENIGLIQFKQHWGTERKELIYSYYPENPSSISSNRDGGLYLLANKGIQHMPTGLYKMMSNNVFRHFG